MKQLLCGSLFGGDKRAADRRSLDVFQPFSVSRGDALACKSKTERLGLRTPIRRQLRFDDLVKAKVRLPAAVEYASTFTARDKRAAGLAGIAFEQVRVFELKRNT